MITPKRILLAVSGMSPQIITETLYALVTAEQPWIPDEIHLVTTLEGRKNAELQLLAGDRHFHQLLQEYAVEQPILFNHSTIKVIQNSDGKELEDLRTPEDNEAAADCICEKVRELTQEPDTELHVSLAGGRKTMGFYAGYALSLFGRSQDRLSHVLVSEDYESLRDFFYPAKTQRVIYKVQNGISIPLDASLAHVWLAQIPFVRLRSFLPDDALVSRAKFSEVVSFVDIMTSDQPLPVIVDLKRQQLRVGNWNIPMAPVELAMYLAFVRRLKQGDSELVLRKNDSSEAFGKEFLQALEEVKGEMGDMERSEKTYKKGMAREEFDSIRSRTKKAIKAVLGAQGAKKIEIQSGPHGSSTFYLELEPSMVTVEG